MVCGWQQSFPGLKDAVFELGIKGLLWVCGEAFCACSACARVCELKSRERE